MANRRTNSYFPPDQKPPLAAECLRRVQFDEVDALGIVWHGRYLSYFEQGRNEWGRKFSFTYQDMYRNGFAMPIVQLHIDHFHPLRYDELMRIKTKSHWTEAAKMNFSYEIYAENRLLAAKGYTVQIYTDLESNPMLLRPDFAEKFIQKWDEWSLK
ncbi:MAG: acyl-CoA thioesterase [Firmicutes bacterium]|mgnify:CR=1 FL=1|nr:acyl-CoA thioesterase [Bacillota bacterium]